LSTVAVEQPLNWSSISTPWR